MNYETLPDLLAKNTYPGRGIALGLCPDNKTAVLVYFIMGRSESSRGRVFFKDGDDLCIRLLGDRGLLDASLILYAPVRTLGQKTIVANGDQSDTIKNAILTSGSFESALNTRRFEHDAPHFTPRISGLLDFQNTFSYALSILKCADNISQALHSQFFHYEPIAGFGHFIHTYKKDAFPLPSFSGEPIGICIPPDINEFAGEIYAALHEDNRIALYLRYTDIKTGMYQDKLINRWEG